MHQHTMVLYKKGQSSGDASAYAPIAKALAALDVRTEEAVRKKFEIVHFLVKENLQSFISMSGQIFEMSDQF